MLTKLKSLFLKFVKPLLLDHLKDLHLLDPKLSQLIQDKTHASKVEADALAGDLVTLVEKELAVLINKI